MACLQTSRVLYYVSIILDCYHFVPVFMSDRPSVSIEIDSFRYDFRNGGWLERTNSENDTRRNG